MSRSQLLVRKLQSMSNASMSTERSNWQESQKSPYQADQQVKFLHLQTEVELLLQEVQVLKQQRLATTSDNFVDEFKLEQRR